jgi:dTDP-glucose pyrophosphorylase
LANAIHNFAEQANHWDSQLAYFYQQTIDGLFDAFFLLKKVKVPM